MGLSSCGLCCDPCGHDASLFIRNEQVCLCTLAGNHSRASTAPRFTFDKQKVIEEYDDAETLSQAGVLLRLKEMQCVVLRNYFEGNESEALPAFVDGNPPLQITLRPLRSPPPRANPN